MFQITSYKIREYQTHSLTIALAVQGIRSEIQAAHKCFDAYYANWNVVPFTFEQFQKQYDALMDSKGVQGFEQACT